MKKVVFTIIYYAAWVAMGIATCAGGLTWRTWQFWVIELAMAIAVMFFPRTSLYDITCRHEYHLVPGQTISFYPEVVIPDELHFYCVKCGRYHRVEWKKKEE